MPLTLSCPEGRGAREAWEESWEGTHCTERVKGETSPFVSRLPLIPSPLGSASLAVGGWAQPHRDPGSFLALLLASWVSLSKHLPLSEPQFSHL